MFSYYGSKSKLARYYPEPAFELLIEPFAGAAHYSMLHAGKRVVLNDIDPRVTAIWRHLTRAAPEDILSLPDVRAGLRFDAIPGITEAERDLIRFNTNRGEGHKNVASAFGEVSWLGKRRKMAGQVESVRHWQVVNGDYRCLANVEATWFIDPPYQNKQGRKYRHNNIDFEHLREWVLERRGEVIVCDNSESERWLDFVPLRPFRGIGKLTTELVFHRRQ